LAKQELGRPERSALATDFGLAPVNELALNERGGRYSTLQLDRARGLRLPGFKTCCAAEEHDMDDAVQRHFQDLVLAAGIVYGDWLEGLPADERNEIMAMAEDGGLPGIRLLLGDERRMPELAILMRTRGGDIEAVGALQLARTGQ